MKLSTKAVRAGEQPEAITGAVTTPIFQTATYALDQVGVLKGKGLWPDGFDYSRVSHPTKAVLENKLCQLEGGKRCLAFSSGMAAITALMHTLKARDHIIFSEDVYGGIHRLLKQVLNKFGLESDFIDTNNLELVQNTIRENTKMLFVETPTNPLLIVYDIRALAKLAAEKNVHMVVDNTFATPVFQQPFELGAQTIVHSLTKYLGGHNDLIGGAVITKDQKLFDDLAFIAKSTGPVLGPLDSYLCIRGVKTLAVRMERHAANAQQIAEFLEGHAKVKRVVYPGLASHPQHQIAKRQMSGYGGMITFEVQDLAAAKTVMESVKLWYLAESLGGVESLITHPVTMTHGAIPEVERQRRGITDGLIRLSVGIEDAADLIEDLSQALGRI